MMVAKRVEFSNELNPLFFDIFLLIINSYDTSISVFVLLTKQKHAIFILSTKQY